MLLLLALVVFGSVNVTGDVGGTVMLAVLW